MGLTWDDVTRKASEDYQRALGTTLEVTTLYGYSGEDSDEQYFDPPITVRVVDTPAGDLRHDTGGWLDPYWNVEPVDASVTRLRSCWIYGTSYRYVEDK